MCTCVCAKRAVSGLGADPDGDGATNEHEYILGTVPLNPNPPPVPSVSVAGNQVELRFTARRAAGAGYEGFTRHYVLETTLDAAAGPWTSVPGISDVIANDQTVTVVLQPEFDRSFFRLKVRLAR